MKLVACINWFDEDPQQLASRVRECHSLGATEIVAIDGGYALFPGATCTSHYSQAEAIQDQAYKLDLGCLIYEPPDIWSGNEVEKRQRMLDLTLAITGEQDWWLLYDSDFHLESDPIDVKPLIQAFMDSGPSAVRRWGDALLTDSPQDVGWYPVRIFYRALRGMHLRTNHYDYYYVDGEQTTMNNPQGKDLQTGVLLPVKIKHKPHDRAPGRRAKQVAYYEARHRLGVES